MRKLYSVIVDASVLAVPQVKSANTEVIRYVNTLIELNDLIQEKWVSIYLSKQAVYTLFEDGVYPDYEQLEKLLKAHAITKGYTREVNRIIRLLLTKTPSFEAAHRVTDVLSEHLETDPDVIHPIHCNALQSDLERCITLIAILCKYCVRSIGCYAFVLRTAPKREIKIRAQIEYFDHERDDIDLPQPFKFFEGKVSACDNFRGLIECLDESVILADASDNTEVQLAIRIALFKINKKNDIDNWNSIIVPTIGPKFRVSYKKICDNNENSLRCKILESIVETIKEQKNEKVHALRTGRGGNDPQRVRGSDQAKAYRRDIDDEFHLHYWKRRDATVEFASVNYHNDFKIPE